MKKFSSFIIASLILFISSFACAMDAPAVDGTLIPKDYPAHVYIQQLIQDKIKEGKLKRPEDCSFDEAIEQLNLIVSSLRFGKDENYCLNHEEIKAREYTASIYNDLPILGNAFDQQIASLVHYDGHIKKLEDRIIQLIPEIITEDNNDHIIKQIELLHSYIQISVKKAMTLAHLKYSSKLSINRIYKTIIDKALMNFDDILEVATFRPTVTYLQFIKKDSIEGIITHDIKSYLAKREKRLNEIELVHNQEGYKIKLNNTTIFLNEHFITNFTSELTNEHMNWISVENIENIIDWNKTYNFYFRDPDIILSKVYHKSNFLLNKYRKIIYYFRTLKTHPWFMATIGLGTALTSYALWKYFKSDT